ncbi:pkinase-domain-containing protein [Aspergillus terreus]|uniref:Autophagy-related protein 1 n=1 Tax=Aspergillus terreus TaxID=33178 RepID=A0A5M3ZCR9_ASPTE|nr:hypothetical protein ATETN484_0011046100 [Aspergillus terreus]GFF19103.1 pkinase-domain-containing protein [Aspergillus terreus]
MAVDDDPEYIESLVTIGIRVSNQFAALDGLVKGNGDDKDNLTNELQRFELWATSLGLYHGGHSSLDYRFRDSPPLFRVDRLYRLSFKIRNPAMRTGLSKALAYTEVDPDTGVNLIEVYASLDLSHLVELFCCFGHWHTDDLKQHYLVQRLARANTRRRQQFRYWRKRKVKNEEYSKSIEKTLETPQNANIHLEREDPVIHGPRPAPSQPSTATMLNVARVKLEDETSIISTKSCLILAGDKSSDHVSIPPPPAIDSNAKEFECPYCFTICPRKFIAKKAWETHIFRDLRPYVCTFEGCKEPDQHSERSSMESFSWEAWSEAISTGREPHQSGTDIQGPCEERTDGGVGKHVTVPLPTSSISSPTRRVSAPEDRLGFLLANRLELTSILGIGAYSVVYKAVDIHTKVVYAVKVLNKVGLDARQLKSQGREIELHRLASQHPNVVSLVHVMDSVDCTYVVMEFCPEGDLFSSITEKGNFVGNDPLVKRGFLQILDAVHFCHSLGIYHRNLTPENILVTDNGMTLKLTGFGLATTDLQTPDFGCGSTFYMSPECQQSNPRPMSFYESAPNDVWSLGVILVNLTCGRNPWKRASLEDPTFQAYLKDPFFLKSILPLSEGMIGILSRVFECDTGKRITIPDLRSLIVDYPGFTKA